MEVKQRHSVGDDGGECGDMIRIGSGARGGVVICHRGGGGGGKVGVTIGVVVGDPVTHLQQPLGVSADDVHILWVGKGLAVIED